MINLARTSNYSKEDDKATVICPKCNRALELKRVYKIQNCPICKTRILLDAKIAGINILKLDYSHFNRLNINEYEFFFEFDYENQDEILDFLSENNVGNHIISFIVQSHTVKSQDEVFDLDSGKLSMVYYGYDMEDLVLPKEQFDKIKNIVADEILSHELGELLYEDKSCESREYDIDVLIKKINLLDEEYLRKLLKNIPLKLLIAEANRQINFNE